MSVAGWNPLYSGCQTASLSLPNRLMIKTDSAACGGKGKEKRMMLWCFLQYFLLFMCLHGFLSSISSSFDLNPLPPHPNPLACVLLFSACLWDGDIKGIVGPPHTTLYQSGIPLCTLDFPPKHFPPLTLLWPRLQISSDSLLPLMCLHSITLKNEIKPWPHDAYFTPGFGWVHWPSVLHTLCCFRISKNLQ